jgi:hypothetical protein
VLEEVLMRLSSSCLAASAFVFVLLGATRARAEEESAPGLQPTRRLLVALRAATGSQSVAEDRLDGSNDGALVPVAVEVGTFASPRIEVSGLFEYARTRTFAGDSRPLSRGRLGANVRFHLAKAFMVDPWFGVTEGFQFMELPQSLDATGSSAPLVGFFGGLELGVDVRVGALRVGPYVSAVDAWVPFRPDGQLPPAWAEGFVGDVSAGARLAFTF